MSLNKLIILKFIQIHCPHWPEADLSFKSAANWCEATGELETLIWKQIFTWKHHFELKVWIYVGNKIILPNYVSKGIDLF